MMFLFLANILVMLLMYQTFQFENLGNMRVINGEIIPDAYQIEITLA